MEHTSTISTPAPSSAVAEASANDWIDEQRPESIRRIHLGTESTIKAIGGFLMAIAIWGAFGVLRSMGDIPENPLVLLNVAGVIATFLAGLWLRDLESAGRALYTVLSMARVGVLAVTWIVQSGTISPFGVNYFLLGIQVLFAIILPGIVLLILWSPKARMVLSDDYRRRVLSVTGHVG
jgi:hypothetical protein